MTSAGSQEGLVVAKGRSDWGGASAVMEGSTNLLPDT
jgi:hypothetical protein